MKKHLLNERGATSIFTVMILAVLLPLAIFVGLELPKMHESNQKLKDAVDLAASSVVTQVASEGFADGEIYFYTDHQKLEDSAKEMFAYEMGMRYVNGQFIIPKGSNISGESPPQVEVQMFDDGNLGAEGVTVYSKLPLSDKELKERDAVLAKMASEGRSLVDIEKEKNRWNSSWSKKITNPTVVVEAKVTFKKSGFLGKDLTINHYGMSQVKLNFDEEGE